MGKEGEEKKLITLQLFNDFCARLYHRAREPNRFWLESQSAVSRFNALFVTYLINNARNRAGYPARGRWFSFCSRRASGSHHTRTVTAFVKYAIRGMQIREAKPGAISTYSPSLSLFLYFSLVPTCGGIWWHLPSAKYCPRIYNSTLYIRGNTTCKLL